MSTIRAMAILEGPSGLPTDRYISNFHFIAAGNLTPGEATTIADGLDAFYALVDPFIPSGVTRLDYRIYDLADPMPREPTFIAPVAQPSGLTPAFPFEVSACLSYYGERNIRRQRGRVYIGPLLASAGAPIAGSVDPFLTPALQQAMLDAGQALAGEVDPGGAGGVGTVPWAIYSPTADNARKITNLWVDNTFDTMRSRGTEPSSRLSEIVFS